MQYPRTIRNFNGFIDGIGYAGLMIEAKLPELKLKTGGFRGAGMDAPIAIDLGMEAMQAECTLAEWRPELVQMFGTRQRMTLRPTAAGEADFSADEIVASLGGRWSVVNYGDLKTGDDVPMKLTLEVDYYRMLHNGEELFEIDVQAGKRVIGGVDQLAEQRRAMGL